MQRGLRLSLIHEDVMVTALDDQTPGEVKREVRGGGGEGGEGRREVREGRREV